jgi:hypothetical protein
MLASLGGSSVQAEHSMWQTDFGPMVVLEVNDHWLARYPQYEGVIIGQVQPGMVDGLWVQPRSDQQCSSPINLESDAMQAKLPEMDVPGQSPYWGNIEARFDAGRFEGSWNYCGSAAQAGTWAGTEICRVKMDLPTNR